MKYNCESVGDGVNSIQRVSVWNVCCLCDKEWWRNWNFTKGVILIQKHVIWWKWPGIVTKLIVLRPMFCERWCWQINRLMLWSKRIIEENFYWIVVENEMRMVTFLIPLSYFFHSISSLLFTFSFLLALFSANYLTILPSFSKHSFIILLILSFIVWISF